MTSNVSIVMVIFAAMICGSRCVLGMSSGLHITCYNSKGWCEAECSLPCYYVNHCNGFRFMHACPSILLLFSFILVCILLLGLLICCISFCCCRCCSAAKALKERKESESWRNDAVFRSRGIQPVEQLRAPESHRISLNSFDDFPVSQVHVTPAPRVSPDNDSVDGWQMRFSKPEETNLPDSKKKFAIHYK